MALKYTLKILKYLKYFAVIKYPNKGNLREKVFILVHGSSLQSSAQDSERVGYSTFIIRKRENG